MINPYVKARLIQKYPNIKFIPMEENEDYKIGETYLNGYWGHLHTIIEIENNAPIWSHTYTERREDGEIITHATKPDYKRDYRVIFEGGKNND